MKTYRIFLASSSELEADRRAYEVFIGRENKRLKDKNVFLHLEIWEDTGDAMSQTRSQDEYNRLLVNCDLFVMLYWTKVGKYTREEYDLARRQFLGTNKPQKIYTYHKTIPPLTVPSQADADSLQIFEQELSSIGHFPIQYDSAEGLQLHFSTRLNDLFEDGTLSYGEIARCLSAGQPAVPEGFIGREDELRTIRQRMNDGGTLMLINSEGGMGKTSIAAKYWKKHEYAYTHNAWLFCENGIVEEIRKLAPQLNLDLSQLPEDQHLLALRTALQKLPADCLLVLDNANNPDDIKAFRHNFSGLHWHVLITSRCQNVLEKRQELPITHLHPPSAKALFTSYYNEQTPEFEPLLDRLLFAIGYNTLLIELFAKNMAELAALGETLADLLKHLEETKSLFLGERSFEVITPYTTHGHQQAATTDEIIDALYDLTKLSETDRYRLVNMALLPAESHLLTILIELFTPDNKIALRNELASLAQKGWLTTDTQSYRISPVVQKIVLTKNKQSLWGYGKELVVIFTNLLDIESNTDNIVNKFKWISYAQSLNANLTESTTIEYSYFQNNLAVILREESGINNLMQAKALLEKALKNNISNFGKYFPTVARNQRNLALTLSDLGGRSNLDQAQVLLEDALSCTITNFGEKHPLVAELQANLAGILQNIGGRDNLHKALSLLKVSLQTTIANIGKQSPDVATRQSNLAVVLERIGGGNNLQEAKELIEEALINAILNFGERAPIVAIRQTNLASVLEALGGEANLHEAQKLLERALNNIIFNFGENYPKVAITQSNLANVLGELSKLVNSQQAISSLEYAKSLLKSALNSDINNWGEAAPNVAIRQANLAAILRDIGGEENLKQAKALLEVALANDIINFGERSHSVAMRQINLAAVLSDLGNQQAACQLWLKAYWILGSLFGDEHEHTQIVLNALFEYCPECFGQE